MWGCVACCGSMGMASMKRRMGFLERPATVLMGRGGQGAGGAERGDAPAESATAAGDGVGCAILFGGVEGAVQRKNARPEVSCEALLAGCVRSGAGQIVRSSDRQRNHEKKTVLIFYCARAWCLLLGLGGLGPQARGLVKGGSGRLGA